MTCVPQMGKQLCRMSEISGVEDKPDLSDCRRGCQCKAYTDRDIKELEIPAEKLKEIVEDISALQYRVERERRELERVLAVLENHKGRGKR